MYLTDAHLRATDPSCERGAVICDPHQPDCPVVYVNDAFLRHTGYTRAEVIGRNCRFLQGPDTDPRAVEVLRRAVQTAKPVTVELLNYRRDGTPFWTRVQLRPLFDSRGRVEQLASLQEFLKHHPQRQRPSAALPDSPGTPCCPLALSA